MKKIKIIAFFLVISLVLFPLEMLMTQYRVEWSNEHTTTGKLSIDKAGFIAADKQGNIIVTGVTNSEGKGDDITTIKYNKDGKQVWLNVFDGSGNYNDRPAGIAVDNSGNIYITGSSTGSGGTSTDLITLKYGYDGNLLWSKVFASAGGLLDEGSSIAVDANGDVYVTGTAAHIVTENSGQDWITIKYNTNGEIIWQKAYDDNISNDKAETLTIDNEGNVYVAGRCNAPAYHIGIAKYDREGNLLWITKYDGELNSHDKPAEILVDASGNVYTAGYSSEANKDLLVIKLDHSGNILWKKTFNGTANGSDEANNLVTDDKGNVYLLGTVEGKKNKHYRIIIKYDGSGNEIWKNISDKPLSKNIESLQLLLNPNGSIVVTGSSVVQGNVYSEMAADCFSPAGELLWQLSFLKENNIPSALNAALDPDGNVILCGFITGTGNLNYCTVKFSK
ncbi:MAG: SBBP repeat-containing protein [Ignavibacteria bacterium]|nr:SBBP repeat-containing protein [Ignavibacteria bacterium]